MRKGKREIRMKKEIEEYIKVAMGRVRIRVGLVHTLTLYTKLFTLLHRIIYKFH